MPTPARNICSKIARHPDICGRSTMTKGELVDAVKKANRRASRSNS
jgi:hypothetical protein